MSSGKVNLSGKGIQPGPPTTGPAETETTGSSQQSQGRGGPQSQGAGGSSHGPHGLSGPGSQGRGHAFGHSIGVGNPHRGSGVQAGGGSGNLPPAVEDAIQYLTGRESGGPNAPGTRPLLDPLVDSSQNPPGRGSGGPNAPGARPLLDHVTNTIGQSNIQGFIDSAGQSGSNLIGGLLQNYANSNAAQVVSSLQAQGLVNQMMSAVQLQRYFTRLERTIGAPAQRARDASFAFLSRPGSGWDVSELLYDLRCCCFMPGWEEGSSYPTEDLLISMQLAALMRSLESQASFASPGFLPDVDPHLLNALMKWLGIDEATARLLLALGPQLPGRAAKLELIAFLALLGGSVLDSKGAPLLTLDGKPLKPGELLWFGPLGGMFETGALDRNAAKPSAFIGPGFDAIFSLIGFDGRALPMPRFLAVQAQVNGSSPEWLFGQVPFSEGWVRALIERLKDAAAVKKNALGERLEEALSDGRFYLGMFKGRVADGRALPETFDLSLAPRLGASRAAQALGYA